MNSSVMFTEVVVDGSWLTVIKKVLLRHIVAPLVRYYNFYIQSRPSIVSLD